RQFLERMEKPDVDSIDGIAPAIAIRQKNSVRNPRSTVGTTTEIHDYLRLLWARIGQTICRRCGRVVERESPELGAKGLLGLPAGTRLLVGFDLPIVTVAAPAAASTDTHEDAEAETGTAEPRESLFGPASGNGAGPAQDPVVGALQALRRRGFG